MEKLRRRFLGVPLVLLITLSLSMTALAYDDSGTVNQEKAKNEEFVQHEVSYQIITKEGEVREEVILPIDDENLSPRLSFGSKTLYNGDVMILVPYASPTSGFWMTGGTYMYLRYSLNKNANMYITINKNPGGIIQYHSGSTGGGSLGTKAPSTGYYVGKIRNSSSNAVTVTSASFDF